MLELFSIAAPALAVATLMTEGLRWQLVPWQVLALAVAVAAALRRWRPGHSRRWRRMVGRGVLVVGLALGGLALLTALVPTLPKPSGPHRVGSVIFRWTDDKRSETFTADPSDRRQVVAQAWYPTDATTGQAVPYFEAQGRLPSSISGLPSFMFASFGSVATHATVATPGQCRAANLAGAVLLARVVDPARGVHGSLRRPCEPRLRGRGAQRPLRVIGFGACRRQGRRSDDPPGCDGAAAASALERLIDIRAADSRFALDQLGQLARLEPRSPLAGHLDLQHVGIVGHSIGGATAVQAMASDPRFKVGVNLDGKLFGTRAGRAPDRPFLWIQSDVTQTTEYTQGRDRFLSRQGDGAALLTIPESQHLSFTDDPSYLTSLGRGLVGTTLGMGSVSLGGMTSMAGNAIAAFVGPPLGVESGPSLGAVRVGYPGIRVGRHLAFSGEEARRE